MTWARSPRHALSQHTSAGERVRSMTRAYRVDSTHIRTVLAHAEDSRGVLETLLDHTVLHDVVRIAITREAWTIEAFACQFLGTSFLGLTFSLHPSADRSFPSPLALTWVEPGRLRRRTVQHAAQLFERFRSGPLASAAEVASDEDVRRLFDRIRSDTTYAMYDTARRPTPVFDGTVNEEFVVERPVADPPPDEQPSFLDLASEVTRLTGEAGRPLSFVHAPVATPTPHDVPRGVSGPCLRFGVAFPRYDDSLRLRFGANLVERCCRKGYGLWQRAADDGYDFWAPVVAPRSTTEGSGPGAPVDPAAGKGVAVTLAGPARAGSTQAVLQVLREAKAPLLGLAETALDDIALIHLFTRTTLDEMALAPLTTGGVLVDARADDVLSFVLGLDVPVRNQLLADYRMLVTPRPERPQLADLAALWLSWTVPATPDALRLTVQTLRNALDATAARQTGGRPGTQPGHLNIEYLVARASGADRLRGRMRVAVDLTAIGVSRPGGGVVARQLGRFCSDVERQWQASLSFALSTPHVDLEVVWRESWLGHRLAGS